MSDGNVHTSGVRDPIGVTPARPERSVRRTSHIDMERLPGGGVRLRGAARDLLTAGRPPVLERVDHRRGGQVARELAAAEVSAILTSDHELAELSTSPGDPRAQALVGLPVRSGFRAAVGRALPDERDAASPLHLLLDDLPVAALISGYALLYSGRVEARPDSLGPQADICAGWQAGGTMMVALRTDGRLPVPLGPPANSLVPDDDPRAWHTLPPLPPGAMRRQRLVEVAAGDPGDPRAPLGVWAMFRDSHVDEGGEATVLHEYSLTAELDPSSLVVTRCEARPQVLPWPECPLAAASAERLVGRLVGELPDLVRAEFRGTTTCTHLNDLLRSLGGLAALTPAVPGTTQ
jgi:hypothetical protein